MEGTNGVAQARRFKIEYEDETILADGRVITKRIPFGSMVEDEAGERTMELTAYPNTTFLVEEIKTEVAV